MNLHIHSYKETCRTHINLESNRFILLASTNLELLNTEEGFTSWNMILSWNERSEYFAIGVKQKYKGS